VLKLYLGYKRYDNRILKIIKINEENVAVQYGYSSKVIKTLRKFKIDNTI